MVDLVDLVGYPVFTKKSAALFETLNLYTFDVDPRLTKTKMKMLIEQLFDVQVASLNSHRSPKKKKRIGQYEGYRKQSKRVLLTLRGDATLPLFAE